MPVVLFRVVVGDCGPFFDLAEPAYRLSGEQHRLGERCLARTGVRQQRNVTNLVCGELVQNSTSTNGFRPASRILVTVLPACNAI